MGSSSMPMVVIWPRLRARYPSMPSEMETRIKNKEAITSCSPCQPPCGKCGESIQMSTGTQKMRPIVMELGRFTGGRPCCHYAPAASTPEPGNGSQPIGSERILVAILVGSPLERQLNQPVDQLRIGYPGRRPQSRVHADRRKSRQSVDLVHVDAPGFTRLHQEIHPREARAVAGLKSPDRHLPDLLCLFPGQLRRHDEVGALTQVLRFVIVELLDGYDFSHHRSLRIIVAQNRDFQLARLALRAAYPLLDHDFAIELRSQLNGRSQLFA